MTLPTILRHLSVLESAGLISTTKDGRVRSCAFQPAALEPVQDWLASQRSLWEARLDRLDSYVMKLMQERAE
jgi:DNA-binding transcriptional ArsR family regulator